MDIKDAALYLLLLRLVSAVALGWVIYKQVQYLRLNQPPEEQKIRFALLGLTLILALGNVIPILVDIYTLADASIRSTRQINAIGVAYTFNNAGFAAIAGIGWAMFYILAERLQVHVKQENKELHEEVDSLHVDAAANKITNDDLKAKNAKLSKKSSKKA